MQQSPRLSNRERETIQLLLEGKSNKLIALDMKVSERTIEFHLKNIYSKFQVNSRMELVLKLKKLLFAAKALIFHGLRFFQHVFFAFFN